MFSKKLREENVLKHVIKKYVNFDKLLILTENSCIKEIWIILLKYNVNSSFVKTNNISECVLVTMHQFIIKKVFT